jgi:hypothetical protein
MTTEAFPLHWPDGWPRTPYRESNHPFGGKVHSLTFERARDGLRNELALLGATDIVLSSNVALRADGEAAATHARKRMSDPGVAVYFILKKRTMVMAQDKYTDISANIRSLAMAIDGMRQLRRHGGGTMMERAFSGFLAIAPPDWKKPWREVFGVKPDWTGDLTSLFREKAKIRHPDSGGNDNLMAELNIAYKEARKELGL